MSDESARDDSDPTASDRHPKSRVDKLGRTIHPPVYRDAKGRFSKGSSGNPLGRRPREVRAIGMWQFERDFIRGMEELVWTEEEDGKRVRRPYIRQLLEHWKERALEDPGVARWLIDRYTKVLAAYEKSHREKTDSLRITEKYRPEEKRDLEFEKGIKLVKRSTWPGSWKPSWDE
jgi:hypothetical protein